MGFVMAETFSRVQGDLTGNAMGANFDLVLLYASDSMKRSSTVGRARIIDINIILNP